MEGICVKNIREGDCVVLKVKRSFYPLGSKSTVCLEFEIPPLKEPIVKMGGYIVINEDDIITRK